ncbi:MAG: helix-turn-helix transcriptional regulator [Pleurocapsa sp. MO_226.B13]|nr:helix-turn-helix transcriptional regulator [Pleurocapsa sp. MO_226.B13]
MPKTTPDEKQFSAELKLRISNCLKRVMFEFDISGVELADISGLDSTYISHLRNGKRLPSFENFIKLVESLPDEAQVYLLDLLFQKKEGLKIIKKNNTSKV